MILRSSEIQPYLCFPHELSGTARTDHMEEVRVQIQRQYAIHLELLRPTGLVYIELFL